MATQSNTTGGETTSGRKTVSFQKRDEFTLSDEVWQKSQAYNADGTVDVGIYDFERRSRGHETITLYFRTPALEEKSETMDWPAVPSDDYKLIRVLDELDMEFNSIEWLRNGDPEIARADPETWKLVAPEKTTVWDRLQNIPLIALQIGGVLSVMAFAVLHVVLSNNMSGALFWISVVWTIFVTVLEEAETEDLF
jgi:hypothetical protein